MRGLGGFRLRTILAALFALATALAGGPHGRPPPDAGLAAYALPDGTAPEICGGHAETPGPAHAGCCLDCLLLAPLVQAAIAAPPQAAPTVHAGIPLPPAAPETGGWRPAAARAPPISFA
jgi:hypothetical protein